MDYNHRYIREKHQTETLTVGTFFGFLPAYFLSGFLILLLCFFFSFVLNRLQAVPIVQAAPLPSGLDLLHYVILCST